ncbi:MAG TPA: NAD(P)H-dependent oxidoreductase [Accumulibacter sp.]|uniref:NADPH-dependent FMN reductase n=1 Tax=Accumulibacter sp. TaxID=2053492 RepID=UPI002879483D|nr:NAD(P)H-dependent oxidoreductase [Accumulibacter sp.]MDS4054077.1 NAD(P)H-dependent oxidoreductase [Accumulibacter sp.]HMW62434.1 NAD(P)H-dependent oxidoreductase [Accumulibacter sp.]HMW79525.1 NAD(P)H-dependent oxidoreductase [Accumulibacter sp.]HMX67829.1 NAD(P)H-dependent oxidoreductase [Accumulibacter sp.]HNB67031.1 NAD(P)H-dependent oxidoreductase [Accumulibacter sp.]
MPASTVRLLAFAGSGRKDSLNRRLLAAAVAIAQAQGAEVTVLDLQADTLPLYDGDLEDAGLPARVIELKHLFAAHDGFLVASPEYNSFFTPLLKNTIDWLSRPAPAGVPEALSGRTAAIFGASPGALGGIRGLPYLRLLLSRLGVLVSPNELAVGNASQVIGNGKLDDPKLQQALAGVIGDLIRLTAAHRATR